MFHFKVYENIFYFSIKMVPTHNRRSNDTRQFPCHLMFYLSVTVVICCDNCYWSKSFFFRWHYHETQVVAAIKHQCHQSYYQWQHSCQRPAVQLCSDDSTVGHVRGATEPVPRHRGPAETGRAGGGHEGGCPANRNQDAEICRTG